MRDKRFLKHLPVKLAVVVLLVPAFLAFTVPAEAWTRSRTRTGWAGRSATKNVTGTRTGTGYNRTATVTGPQGNTATRQSGGNWDPATKTWTRNVVVNGPFGQ
jgi:hypothetical protein